LLLLPILAILLAFPASFGSAGAPRVVAGSPVPVGQPGHLPDGTLALPPRPEGNPRLDGALQRLAAAAALSVSAAQGVGRDVGLRLEDGRVHAQMTVDLTQASAVMAAVRAGGGEVTGAARGGALLQAWLPVGALESLAAVEGVRLIHRPAVAQWYVPVAVASAITEALAAMNADAWHAQGYTGQGIKVGIIDGGFLGYSALLGTDLPAIVTATTFVDGEIPADVEGLTAHGTACAEIVHDVAPGAALYLAKIETNVDLAEAVAWLRDSHAVDVISTSIGWFNLTPGDGSGELADLVDSARAAGILWVTAAGNARLEHWGGAFSDTDASGCHEFDGQNWDQFGAGDGSYYAIPPGQTINAYLRWDEWDAPTEDLDLYLLRWNGSAWDAVASSTDPQGGVWGQRPTETIVAATTGADTFYALAVERVAGTRAVNLELFAYADWRLDRVVYSRSLANLADAPNALTVAALDSTAPYAQEPYSSEGPTNGPGGTADGGLAKPDLSAYANVSTASYGTGVFNGTSSAAPHAAGAAALMLGAHPAYSVDQLEYALEALALDLGDAGPDTQYGYGRLYLGDPLEEPVTPTPTPSPTPAPSATPTPTPGTYDWRRVGLARRGVRDISLHPEEAGSAIASTEGDDLGLMVTHDAGATWTQANHGLGDLEVLRLAREPTLPWVLYAAGRDGLWRSGDGGLRWDAVALPRSPVSRLSALGTSALPPGRVYLTAWEPCRMTFVSSDGGDTWQEYQGPELCSYAPLDSSLVASPRDPNVLYLARAHDRPEIYRSDDGGQTWRRLSDVPGGPAPSGGVNDLAVDPRDDDHVYAATWGAGVYETEDAGVTWHAASLGLPASGAGADVTAIIVDPERAGVVYAAVAGAGVYRTLDGGGWWEPYNTGMGVDLAVNRLGASPARPERLWAATSDGVWTRLSPSVVWLPVALRE